MAVITIDQVIDALTSFPKYTDYQSQGKIAYAEAVKTWLSQLIVLQTQFNALREQANLLSEDVNTKSTLVSEKEALLSPHYDAIDAITTGDNLSKIDITAANITSILSVANVSNLADIVTVAQDLNAMDLNGIADVTVVANDLVLGADSKINKVSAALASIIINADNIAVQNTIASNISDLLTISDNIGNLNTIASQITDMLGDYYSKAETDALINNTKPSAPTISLAGDVVSVNENSRINGQINNFDKNITYYLSSANLGNISYNVDTGSFIYPAEDIIDGVNHSDILSIYYEIGTIVSSVYTKYLTIVFQPSVTGTTFTFSGATDIDVNDGFDYLAPNVTTNKDIATLSTRAKLNGKLTISNSDVDGFDVEEDLTDKTTVYIKNAENTADYLAVPCTYAAGHITYNNAVNSAATEASDETKIVLITNIAFSDNPTKIIVDDTSDASTLKSITPMNTSDSVIALNAVDGVLPAQNIGTVTTSSRDIVSSTDPFGDGNLLAKLEFKNNYADTLDNITPTPTDTSFTTGKFGQGIQFESTGILYLTGLVSSIYTMQVYIPSTDNSGYIFDARPSNAGHLYVGAGLVNLNLISIKINGVTALQGDTLPQDEWFHLYIETPIPATSVRIGSMGSAGYQHKGVLDHIEAWANPLTDEQIAVDAAQSITVYSAPITGLTHKPDKAFFNTAIDYSISVTNTENDEDNYQALMVSRAYNDINGNFDVTLDTPLTVSGRSLKLKIEAEKTGSNNKFDNLTISTDKEG
jgi:hypothetical protein